MSMMTVAACMLLAGDRAMGDTVLRVERVDRRARKVRVVFAGGDFLIVDRELGVEAERPAKHCDGCREGGPSHYGSARCESGSLASGGTRAHCSCDRCF